MRSHERSLPPIQSRTAPDELLRAVRQARTSLVDLEELTDEELATLQSQFRALRARESARPARPCSFVEAS